MTTGARIKRLREQMNLSVDELASQINKSRATVYRYEKGEIDDIPMRIVEKLAEALCTTAGYLMCWTDDPRNYDLIVEDSDIPLEVMKHFGDDTEGMVRYREAVEADMLESSILYGPKIEMPSTPAEAEGDAVSVEEMTKVLRRLGYLRRDETLTDEDVNFLSNVFGLLDTWFESKRM